MAAAAADVRCPATLHARLVDGELEIKCGRRSCGHGPGIVVLHRFSITTGELLKTLQYRQPHRRQVPCPS